MKKGFYILLAFCLIGFIGHPCDAEEEVEFQKTADEIISKLTSPEKDRHSLTRAFKPKPPAKRIQVMKMQKDDMPVKKEVEFDLSLLKKRAHLNIRFDKNSYAIRPSSYPTLGELGKALTDEKLSGKKLLIAGHADSDGPNLHNLNLSLYRAQAVKNYLLGNFPINKERLEIIGYGESLPLLPNDNPKNKQKNRRVEVQMVQ
ncbi:MAG: OmpA family protein [Desulfobacterales bacterium]|nr:OmpA family protein [Desulfobacterales bacterium]